MRQKLIHTNQSIRIYARIRNISGDLADPSIIEFQYTKHNDTEPTVYSIGRIVKESTGVFYINIEIEEPGRHKYTWVTDGLLKSAYKGFFEAIDHQWERP